MLRQPRATEMAVSIFAFYGRSSTEDQQDPASSRTWQLTGSQSLIRGFTAVVIGEPARAFYGNQFSLTFPLFVHYGIQLWGCRKWEAQSILRWMLTAPQPGQSCQECASIDYATAEGLTRDRIVCPSAADPGRNRHRSGIAWPKSAIRVILANPRTPGTRSGTGNAATRSSSTSTTSPSATRQSCAGILTTTGSGPHPGPSALSRHDDIPDRPAPSWP